MSVKNGVSETLHVHEDPLCPACGGSNKPESVFCAHCDKALGPFRYVREELAAGTSRFEALADSVTEFIGRPHFFIVHSVWFLLWIAANAGIVMTVRQFDAYPYNLLSILLAVEAIFITGFVLISQNRQQALIEKTAELDYEVNVRAYREIQELKAMTHEVLSRLENMEKAAGNRQREEGNKGI
jgi:uncharacterized membrane protein